MSSRYHYRAAGQEIELIPDDDVVAVDGASLKRSTLDAAVKRSLLAHLQPLRDEISLLQSDLLGNKEREILEAAHALQPVYRSQGAVIVVLPEIRIEDRRQSHWAALRQWLKKHPAKAAVVEDKGDRMTLRVVSGDGRDAIDLANQLTSELDVEVAQPRFLRIVGRPNLS